MHVTFDEWTYLTYNNHDYAYLMVETGDAYNYDLAMGMVIRHGYWRIL